MEIDTSSPVKSNARDARGEIPIAFGGCSSSRRFRAAAATTSCAVAHGGPLAIDQWPEAGPKDETDQPTHPSSGRTGADVADVADPIAPAATIDGGSKSEELGDDHETWHGAGVLSWPDGRKYIGQFCQGAFHGEATMSWPDGRSYIGQYEENKKHGEGEFVWPDGRKYSGTWKHGQRHGHGMYTNAKGEMRHGKWAEDRPVSWEGGVHKKSLEKDPRPENNDPFAVRSSLGGA